VLDRYLKAKPQLREKSRVAYRTAVKGLSAFVAPGATLDMITARDLASYVYEAKKSASTHMHRYRHLRSLFTWAARHGLLRSDPIARVDPPKARRAVPRFLSKQDVDGLIQAIHEGPASHHWLADVVLVAVFTGLRRGELCALQWEDVDLEQATIVVRNRGEFVSKSGHERFVPLSSQAMEVLTRAFASSAGNDAGVFVDALGRPIDGSRTSRLFKHYAEKAGLPEQVKFHDLRHTCASWMVQRGRSLLEVQMMLGHSSVQMAQRYAHLAPDALRAAVDEAFG
jgi:site-specific recombinase XerD